MEVFQIQLVGEYLLKKLFNFRQYEKEIIYQVSNERYIEIGIVDIGSMFTDAYKSQNIVIKSKLIRQFDSLEQLIKRH
ncbi:unnamed protein product [Paramecium sonneborni]|uniref:Uncharacterized protein n=1 Tax=Paramecium sonneborni TaxID=65129 RepID=A0A8S1L9I0_9CILI|nr:unnamed protein product [Paramecium sonneborni]